MTQPLSLTRVQVTDLWGVAQGCIELLERYNVQISGKIAVVIGRSNIVGMPAALLLQVRLHLHTHTRTHTGALIKKSDPETARLNQNYARLYRRAFYSFAKKLGI
jgi:5,10-methylene-tetrahydrofolate dehydrogenase/methenyl tetrahydrofolate cyclohydrolase